MANGVSGEGANNITSLNGYFKEVYAPNLKDLVPEGIKLGKMIDFVKPSQRMGLEYHQPVTLRLEHGVTYGGEAGDAFELNVAIAGATKDAKVKGCEMVLRGRVSMGAISRSVSDAASFGSATKHVIKNIMISSFKKQEAMLFYGQKGLAVSSFDGNNTGTPGTSIVVDAGEVGYILLDKADFAAGIFAGGEGMLIDLYNGATLVSSKIDIVGVDIKGKRLKVDFTNASAAIAVAIAAVNLTGESVQVYEYGAKGKECLGLQAMLDGSVAAPFGITSADYSLWEGNRHTIATTLSFKEISFAIADAVSKGLEGKLDAFVSPITWADLLDEQTANIKDQSFSTKKYENGSESIVFHSQNGIIEVHSSTYVKEGLAFVLDLKSLSRVGSTELQMNRPGSKEEYVIKLENANGIEFRSYCDTALFCDAIGHNIIIDGIVNS